jgi:signal transduction histidine kinase
VKKVRLQTFLQSIHPQVWGKFLKIAPIPLVMGTAGLTLLLFAPLAWIAGKAYQNFNNIQQNEFRLRQLSDQITYYDEVLTMSARMNAATADHQWEERYHAAAPKLDAIIQESIQLARSVQYNAGDAEQTDAANVALVALETQSFALVQQGQPTAAAALLNGSTYAQWKAQYGAGVSRRNAAIQTHLTQKIEEYQHNLITAMGMSGLSILLLLPAWTLVLRILKTYLRDLQQAQVQIKAANQALELTNQNLEATVAQRSRALDERNQELTETVNILQETQMQLVQSAKMSSLGQLVAGIAHEVNNPVNFIHGNLQYFERYSQDLLAIVDACEVSMAQPAAFEDLAEQYELSFLRQDLPKLLASMQTGTQRIRDIVLSLRNFSRLDEAELKVVDLHDGIESTLMILQHRLQQTTNHGPIRIVKQYDEALPRVHCYPGLLNQVLMNLVANAIDAVAPNPIGRPPQIIIQTLNQGEHIHIGIGDNGSGISADHQQSLFNPFFTTKPVGEGTGLGLSISYKIITEQHGGKIWVESAVNQGTTFWIELPNVMVPNVMVPNVMVPNVMVPNVMVPNVMV